MPVLTCFTNQLWRWLAFRLSRAGHRDHRTVVKRWRHYLFLLSLVLNPKRRLAAQVRAGGPWFPAATCPVETSYYNRRAMGFPEKLS